MILTEPGAPTGAPGRVISPSSGSVIVVHHSAATRAPVMTGRPIRTVTSRWGSGAALPVLTDGITAQVGLAEDTRLAGSTGREQVNDLVSACCLPGSPGAPDPLVRGHRMFLRDLLLSHTYDRQVAAPCRTGSLTTPRRRSNTKWMLPY